MTSNPARIWAVVPAAGVGRRMGREIPKQYLELAGKPVIVHTLERLASCPAIHAIVVAVSADDAHWQRLAPRFAERVHTARGGAERADSVLAALRFIGARASRDDLALVHDAVRPCLGTADLERVIEVAVGSSDGALLAVPVRDTMKRADGDRIRETIEREGLWHALTPQAFRLGLLLDALAAALERNVAVTDEAQAVEMAGRRPRIVEGCPDNIKITRAGDLALAEFFLSRMPPCA